MIEGLKIFDNFFENPDEIRAYALSLRCYEPCDLYTPGIYSGYRVMLDYKIKEENEILHYVSEKIQNLYKKQVKEIILTFHLNTKVSICGAPHYDVRPSDVEHNRIDKKFAGVIYLTPNPPINSGTTIYKNDFSEYDELNEFGMDKLQIIYSVNLPISNSIKKTFGEELKEFKSKLKVDTCVENVYNRFITYPSIMYHSPDDYFGDTLEDGRLSISIHGTFKD